jgi:hypothetical protein
MIASNSFRGGSKPSLNCLCLLVYQIDSWNKRESLCAWTSRKVSFDDLARNKRFAESGRHLDDGILMLDLLHNLLLIAT